MCINLILYTITLEFGLKSFDFLISDKELILKNGNMFLESLLGGKRRSLTRRRVGNMLNSSMFMLQ